jgi:hypothetical protein
MALFGFGTVVICKHGLVLAFRSSRAWLPAGAGFYRVLFWSMPCIGIAVILARA